MCYHRNRVLLSFVCLMFGGCLAGCTLHLHLHVGTNQQSTPAVILEVPADVEEN